MKDKNETQKMKNEMENTDSSNAVADNNTNSNFGHRWTNNETKYLLDQYRIYFTQIGPFQTFKNKAAMFEQIRKDLFTKFNIIVTGEQCLNRYKTSIKQNKKSCVAQQIFWT